MSYFIVSLFFKNVSLTGVLWLKSNSKISQKILNLNPKNKSPFHLKMSQIKKNITQK
jgi:hypothetical protein